MTSIRAEFLTPVEAGMVAGVSVKAVYKALRGRLPKSEVRRRGTQVLLTETGALCLKLDRELPRGFPAALRRRLLDRARSQRPGRFSEADGVLSYVVDIAALRRGVSRDLTRYRAALARIVEDPAIQSGAPVFKGTRILVRQIADLLASGETEALLREDYPRLTPAMIEAARIYAAARPARGRPRRPNWRRKA